MKISNRTSGREQSSACHSHIWTAPAAAAVWRCCYQLCVFHQENHSVQVTGINRQLCADNNLLANKDTWRHRPLHKRIRSISGVRIQNLVETSLSEDTSMIKFSWRSNHFFQRYEPTCGKMPYLAMLKNPWSNSGSWSGYGWLSKFNQFFSAHRYISGKVFNKIRSPAFKWSCWQTNKQKDGQILDKS